MLKVVLRKPLAITCWQLIDWQQLDHRIEYFWRLIGTVWSQLGVSLLSFFCSFHANAPNSQVLLSMFSFSCSCLTRYYLSFFFLFVCFFFFFSFWVRSRCGWLRGFVDFITRRIFRGMKLNANSEQIEGKLYFNIRGNFSLKLGWGRCLIKHVYTIIIIFKMFTPLLLLFSKCLRHYHYFQNVYTITIFKMFTTLLFSFFPKS